MEAGLCLESGEFVPASELNRACQDEAAVEASISMAEHMAAVRRLKRQVTKYVLMLSVVGVQDGIVGRANEFKAALRSCERLAGEFLGDDEAETEAEMLSILKEGVTL